LKLRTDSADERGSMMLLFVAFTAAIVFLAAAAIDLGAFALQRQRLQSHADQQALESFRNREQLIEGTAIVRICKSFEPAIKIIGLPSALEICVRSAAR
jgi:Flp pilus assembly protein TadG